MSSINTGTSSDLAEGAANGYRNPASAPLSAAEYRSLVENSPGMIWRSGVDARCNYFNETWLAFTGRTLAEELDDGWADGVHPEDLEACVGQYLEHFKKRERFDIEYRLRRYDGEYRWILDRGAPMYAEDGQFVGFIGNCVDVQERHVARETEAELHQQAFRLFDELKEREAKIRRLVESNIVGVVFSNLDGEIFEANDAFLRMLGFTREDVYAGRVRWREITPPEWRAAAESASAQVRTTGNCDVFQREYFRKDGSRVPVLIGVASVDEGREETVAFILDITEQKRADEERERLRAELAYMSRVLTMGELAAAIAHDVKQPITAAMVSADVCERLLNLPTLDVAELREAAARISAEVTRASQIIDRVRLLYTRSAPRKDAVDANELVRDMATLLSGEATRHRIAIRTDLDPTLPLVAADRVQLQQVLLNLMLNAVEAMKATAGDVVIASRRTATNGVTISVTDSGVGLPMGQTDHIFEAFFTTKAEGMGMGLAISRAIVESHGGRLWAYANAERGATFQFTLPHTGPLD